MPIAHTGVQWIPSTRQYARLLNQHIYRWITLRQSEYAQTSSFSFFSHAAGCDNIYIWCDMIYDMHLSVKSLFHSNTDFMSTYVHICSYVVQVNVQPGTVWYQIISLPGSTVETCNTYYLVLVPYIWSYKVQDTVLCTPVPGTWY